MHLGLASCSNHILLHVLQLQDRVGGIGVAVDVMFWCLLLMHGVFLLFPGFACSLAGPPYQARAFK